ncbi:helix-turn-helix domain-containing protein [Massilia sp. SM-13]|uniref:helix-turn-helix domain-containing protein n=1 Tax=Pseudoduganella rhizocola TaxID=3382643 RepID=UPI0038B5B11C
MAQPLLAWRERVGHVVDVVLERDAALQDFSGEIRRTVVAGFVVTDCRTGRIDLERNLPRISTDSLRAFTFQLFPESDPGEVLALRTRGAGGGGRASILAIDLNQPFRHRRLGGRVISLFVEREVLASYLPDAEALHGRVLEDRSPSTHLLVQHLLALNHDLPALTEAEALPRIKIACGLLAAAFGKEARLAGSARAAVRAAAFGEARRRIERNVHAPDMQLEQVAAGLPVSRATLYRMFEQEGGLQAYARQRRLRAAADEIVRFPDLAIKDIALGLGFGSASDFTRAFRRAFGLSPQEFRHQAVLSSAR